MITGELASRAAQLSGDRVPFVVATVVRARRPTSVRPGDAALVTGDGRIDGFVGGVCAESTVRLYALRALETGDPLLVRLVPGEPEREREDAIEGAVVEHNPCLSGGALEIFLEPVLPAARMVVLGDSPIAQAIRGMARAAGFEVADSELAPGDAALIVASHGNDEQHALAVALASGVPYVALVASIRRGEAVRAELDVPDELRVQLHTPAGLDIGARTPAEIAISVLAQIISERHAHPAARPTASGATSPAPGAPALRTAVDPVCGMTVAVTTDTPSLDGQYFCCGGCRDTYAAQHAGA
jgi:xanthine dehydrogenase accessory factor